LGGEERGARIKEKGRIPYAHLRELKEGERRDLGRRKKKKKKKTLCSRMLRVLKYESSAEHRKIGSEKG